MNYLNDFYLFSFFILVSWFCIKLNIFFSNKYLLVDNPGNLKIHIENKLTACGFSLFFIIMINLLIISTINYFDIYNNYIYFNIIYIDNFWLLSLCLILIFLVSILDFFRDIPALTRLIIQISLVYLCFSSTFQNEITFFIPYRLEILLVIYIWLTVINTTNFIDGIDGLLSIKVLIFSIGIIILHYFLIFEIPLFILLTCFSLSAYFVVYLFYNKSPSKIMMSDIGSIPVGFLLGWMVIILFQKNNWQIPTFLLMYFYLDVFYTWAIKLIRSESIFKRHNDFTFHIAIKKGISTNKYLMYVLFLSLLNLTFMIIAKKLNSLDINILLLSLSFLSNLFFIIIIRHKFL